MGYYARILTQSEKLVPLEVIKKQLESNKLAAIIEVEAGDSNNWKELMLKQSNGTKIALVERNAVIEGELGGEEIEEFLEEIEDCKPKSAVQWLNQFLPTVKYIYAFQMFEAAFQERNGAILNNIRELMFASGRSIYQADMDGFTNDYGYRILLQFSDDETGEWQVGILRDHKWEHFEINLENEKHYQAFLSGVVPEGVVTQTKDCLPLK